MREPSCVNPHAWILMRDTHAWNPMGEPSCMNTHALIPMHANLHAWNPYVWTPMHATLHAWNSHMHEPSCMNPSCVNPMHAIRHPRQHDESHLSSWQRSALASSISFFNPGVVVPLQVLHALEGGKIAISMRCPAQYLCMVADCAVRLWHLLANCMVRRIQSSSMTVALQGTRTVLPFARLIEHWAILCNQITGTTKVQPSLYIHMPCAAWWAVTLHSLDPLLGGAEASRGNAFAVSGLGCFALAGGTTIVGSAGIVLGATFRSARSKCSWNKKSARTKPKVSGGNVLHFL